MYVKGGIASDADNITNGAKLKEFYRQAEKYGTGSIKELESGSKLTNNQLNQLKITSATTGGSLFSYGTVINISSQNEYNNVRIAVISRTSDNKANIYSTDII